MDGMLYKKVEEAEKHFIEVYGKGVFDDPDISDDEVNNHYQMIYLLGEISNGIEMESYEEDE